MKHDTEAKNAGIVSGDDVNVVQIIKDVNSVLASPAFRADWKMLLLMTMMIVGVNMFAFSFPATIVSVPLFDFLGITIGIVIPPLLVLPLIVLAFVVHRRFDTRYIITQDRLVQATGLISLKRNVREMYFYYVRGIIVEQSPMGRILGFGTVRVGPLVEPEGDIFMEGIRNPYQYKSLLERRLQNVDDEEEVTNLPRV